MVRGIGSDNEREDVVTNWKNRIIGSGELPASEFLANPMNWRIHPKPQQEAMKGALNEIGWIQEVIVNQNTGNMIDGHLRVTLAMREGEDTPVPVKYVDLTQEEEHLALTTLDPIAAMAAADKQQLDGLMQNIQTGEAGLQEMLSGLAEDNVLYFGEEEVPEDAEPQIDKAEELREKWGVETGQMWQLGEHRIVCGDCTDKLVVDRVMGGEKADMVFTDPPYNVSYQDNESIESLKARNRRTDGLVVSNDSMTDDEFDAFLIAFLSVLPLKNGGAYYLCAPPGRPETQFRIALNSVSGLQLRECIVWIKDVFVFGRQDYHWRHESILYGWKDGAAHYFIDDRKQDTVWEYERPKVSKDHPTMKPVELPNKAIGNSSKSGEVIFDPFLGSGTTLIACERLHRKCRAIEISPAYVAVAIQRWANVTGLEPELIEK